MRLDDAMDTKGTQLIAYRWTNAERCIQDVYSGSSSQPVGSESE